MQDNKRLKRKVRSSYIISTVSITLVLFLLGSVSYLILSAVDATDRMKESVAVYVMLEEELSQQDRETVKERLLAYEGVKSVEFESKDDAARKFIEQNHGDDFMKFLDVNPIPDSYSVRLKASKIDREQLEAFEKKVSGWDEVLEVVYQRPVVQDINPNLNKFNLILVAFGLALLVISVILLNNTIRVTIFARRYMISTMKLVGATDWFIMRPFVGNSILQGIYAGMAAIAMFVGLVWGLKEGLPEVRFVAEHDLLLWIMGAMLLLGVLISLIFTIFAVRKFVRMPTNAIHYY